MNTPELVERVARAMHAEGVAIFLEQNRLSVPTMWEGEDEDVRDTLRRIATAAINELGVERLVETLEAVRQFLTDAPLESGICCCGNPVEGHGFDDGHSPVDDLTYSAMSHVAHIDEALSSLSPSLRTITSQGGTR